MTEDSEIEKMLRPGKPLTEAQKARLAEIIGDPNYWQFTTPQDPIKVFSEAMTLKYFEKYHKYGDSWERCVLSDLESHIEDHWQHTVKAEFGLDQLVGLGLLAMLLWYRRRSG